jgi:two-component system sensor histidine kinase/response regulator
MESRRYAPRLMLDLAHLHKNYVTTGLGDALRSVLQTFVKQLQQNLHTIQEAAASGRFEVLSETAHTLKGAAGSVGALRLADAAEELEGAADRRHTETVTLLAEELARLGDGTLTAIDGLLAQPHDKSWPKPL